MGKAEKERTFHAVANEPLWHFSGLVSPGDWPACAVLCKRSRIDFLR